MSGILHGAKSVVFLILSCGPVYDAKRKWKQKRSSKKARAAKTALVTQQPNLYHHPSPMQTNPYWGEEIAAGPNFVKGKKKVEGEGEGSERGLTSAGTGSTTTPRVGIGRQASVPPSSPTVGGDGSSVMERRDDETWNHKLYQREDEGLWGIDIKVTLKNGQRSVLEALNSAGTTVDNTLRNIQSLLPTFTPTTQSSNPSPETRHPYYVGRNPPVNDLHPPIVSTTPYDTGSMKWMLQPPPPASVMAGKAKVKGGGSILGSGVGSGGESSRSRADSRASTLAVVPPVSAGGGGGGGGGLRIEGGGQGGA